MKISERFYFANEFAHVVEEFDGLSDRAIAIVSGALLEDGLKGALEAQFIEEPKIFEKIFQGNGALATFSARIDMARLIGLYGPDAYKDIDRIRKIRNAAAHTSEPFSFHAQPLVDHCRNMTAPEQYLFEVGHPGTEDGRTKVFVYGHDEVLKDPKLRFVGTTLVAAYQLFLGVKNDWYERLKPIWERRPP